MTLSSVSYIIKFTKMGMSPSGGIAINESSGLLLLVAPHMLRGGFGIAVGTEEIEIGTGIYIDE